MMSDVWTIRRILTWTTGHFEKRGVDAPRLTTEILLAHVLKTGRVRLYVDLDRPLSKDELAAFKALIERRMAGEPTNYLTGTKEFYNRSFKVDARVLIPRPETELLVEAVLHSVPKDAPSRVLDVCTGSGCIAISVAAERPQATVVATDLSKDACALARENAQSLGVAERVSVLEGDLFAPLPPGETFRVVVSNPPYIDSGDIAGLSPEVRREPRLALDGGPDGLVALRRVIQGARRVLEPGGLLALEMGETQGSAVLELLRAAGYADARVEKDLERRERMAFGTQPAA
ncbi:peptide chain release factor N(5)-glutamine methyltransferase [Corallococcus exercitus]|uniref:Release factor glutamine methyltransferase n=1 Tax=Corallococcus exercitus TaxID=2316736 RepID=A0A3A8HLZ4_9BACT|nr:peptide chain release factor N(5)-glutamine methyltransferase [Corallococcus exercitus]NOK38204.1 peptide chain release factor N(5)-glutamine methyltransferase [Corallococcus exercitus]RKG72237.1 peptide chain release factor N(5)-glutamine methyltransferase [Corallococcus exercitus]